MDASIYSPIRITMPDGAPKIVRKEQLPDQRQIVVLPLRAATDKRLTLAVLKMLIVVCSFSNKSGFCWTGQKRMAQDMKTSQQAVSVKMRKLAKFGYIETVYKGFNGERADTIRVIFNERATMQEVIKKTGESAPFLLEKQAKKRGRPRKQKQQEMPQNSNSTNNLPSVVDSEQHKNAELLIALRNKVSDKVWQLAISRCDNPDDYQSMLATINKLLR